MANTWSGLERGVFGRRRKLELRAVPYIVAIDPRHFDDYAQVSENEKRAGLQPIELATFISRKVDQGEAKHDIANRIGISNAALTNLLALVEAPPFLAELYESGKCRSAQSIYRLRVLHTKRARVDRGPAFVRHRR